MLRPRGKTATISGRRPVETVPNVWLLRRRLRVARLRCLCTCLAAALIFLGGFIVRVCRSRHGGTVDAGQQLYNETQQHRLATNDTLANKARLPHEPPRRSAKYLPVDRDVLQKLERMQRFYAPNYYDLPADAVAQTAATGPRWPPIVTRVPERPSRLSAALRNKGGSEHDALCESPAHPRPCLFFLPLRIAEQESKARIHLTQLALLARALNRTLVLPNVGKSKIGACFKWELQTYYDVASLGAAAGHVVGDSDGDNEWFVELEHFRGWLDGRESLKSQLISVGSGLPGHTMFREGTVYSNTDVSVMAYNTFGAWERDLPGCFASKFEKLTLETMPVFVSAPNTTNKDGTVRPIGNAIVDAFSAVSSRNTTWGTAYDPLELGIAVPASDTQVMVVNWDLRHPIFPSSSRRPLKYSKRMHNLVAKYAPKAPYLAVQWRMESVDSEMLEDCAHALVDVLSHLLYDSVLAENISSVWFASDYPYPIASHGSSQRPPGLISKSGTFKDFGAHHEEAIEILRNAFSKQGELSSWGLTDFAEAAAGQKKNIDIVLTNDSGILAILDKLVSIKANLFVSGTSRCSRRRCVQ